MNKDEAIKEIKQLKELLDSGILTQEEYDSKSVDLKKIFLDSEKKKNEPLKINKEKEYWEQKAKEKPKDESTLKPTKAKPEKETVKPKVSKSNSEKEISLKNSSKKFNNKEPLYQQIRWTLVTLFWINVIVETIYWDYLKYEGEISSTTPLNLASVLINFLIARYFIRKKFIKNPSFENKRLITVGIFSGVYISKALLGFILLSNINSYYNSSSKPKKTIESQAPKHHKPNYRQDGSRGEYILEDSRRKDPASTFPSETSKENRRDPASTLD